MRLREARIAIIGLGLMGGSLGLALDGLCARRIGVVRGKETAEQAVRLGAVDSATTDLREGVEQADLVVMSTPVRAILSSIEEVGAYMRPGAVLLDMGSTKRVVVEAMDRLPEHVAAVGGHPMCGKEVGGLSNAEAALYRGATFVLTPTKRTTGEALSLVQELIEGVGAHPLVLDAAQHDRAAALISHLPYLLAASLVHAEARAAEADPVTDQLAASGFRDTTRVAASERDMILDTLLTNREAIQASLDAFERQLEEARNLLADPGALSAWVEQAQQKRRGMFR